MLKARNPSDNETQEGTLPAAALFEQISCPLCEDGEFDVVRACRHPPTVSENDLRECYSASSNHILLDQVVRCRSCSLQYVNPRPRAEVIIESYAGAVDPTFVAQNEERIRTFTQTLRQVMRRVSLASGKGKRLVDVGCAGGACPAAARALGFDVVGVEPSRWMADYGRRTHGLDIREGLLVPGMFPPASLDFLTLWDVLEHVPDPHQLLTLAAELLKPGGVLAVTYPDVGSLCARLMGERWPFWLSVHLLYYDRKTMRRQLERADLEVVSQAPYNPTLQLGYILQRGAPYFPPAGLMARMVNAVGLGRLRVSYNMGQTLAVCLKR